MSVQYILNNVGQKMGLDPAVTTQRDVLLRFLNEATEELYNQADIPGSVMEQVFLVNGNNTVSLPHYVGEIRAIREYNTHIPWHINQMRPRYNVQNWVDMWRNYRIIEHRALMSSIINQSQAVLQVTAVETPNVVVTVSGPTENAANIVESVTMDEVSKTLSNLFTDFVSVTKDRINNYNITMLDSDGNTLTVLPNNRKEARYLIVDVSDLPWSNTQTNTQEHYVEILYKKALPTLQFDGDEFPAPGYDNILVNKMLQLWSEEQDGKEQKAILYDQKASRSLARKKNNVNAATEDTVALVTNGHDEMLPRLRPRRWPSLYPFGTVQ